MSDPDGMAWSYRRGDWFGIFGPHAAVVLPPSERGRVAALWELVDAGAGFDETLDGLISSGLRELTGFVLVSTDDDDVTRVVIRGAARTHLAAGDEVLHVEGDAATTWVERKVSGVTRIRIEVDGEADAVDGLIDTGLVRLACAEHPPAEAARDLDEDVEEPVEEPAEAAVDHDGLTRHPETQPVQRMPDPGIPGQPPAPPVTARPVARLVFSDGETVQVDRTVLVGRAPEPARSTTDDAPRLVTVNSPHHEVSSTHLEIKPGSGADHGAAVVTDLGSTNGTVVVQPGLPPEDLRPGVTVQLVPGALVDLGDGVSIQVVDAT